MKQPVLIPVILSGGVGSRLWPVSRQSSPKPFLKLIGDDSLLQATYRRAMALPDVNSLITVTNQDYYLRSQAEFVELDEPDCQHHYLLETVVRNTAPAILAASLMVKEQYGDDAMLLVLPADHHIENQANFNLAVSQAKSLAEQDKIVTFGINPSRPETGYGYIEVGEPLAVDNTFNVKAFVEKPNLATAQEYLASKAYLWNSGMFCFKAGVMLQAFETLQNDLYRRGMMCWNNRSSVDDAVYLPQDVSKSLPSISIDYAIMEHTDNRAVVKSDMAWSDLGDWESVGKILPRDENNNLFNGDVIALDSKNNYFRSDKRLIAAIGVEDLVVIDTPDALLVTKRDRVQDVKNIVAELKAKEHKAYDEHTTMYRPWGTYTVLEEGSRYKIKLIQVKPGEKLSYQYHHHRNEHWVVVSGTATIVIEDETKFVHTNESTYIQAGVKHRLMNTGVMDLVLIEVQSGDYLGEDDIVRLLDRYGRVAEKMTNL